MNSLMRKLGVAPAVLLLVPLFGCPPEKQDDPDDPGNSTPMTVMEICHLYLGDEELGGADYMCTQAKAMTGLDLDNDYVQTNCRPGTSAREWSEDLMAAHAAGKVTFDWVRAHECVDTSRELRQASAGYIVVTGAEWAALREGACTDFYSGAVGDGGDCTDDWDCTEGSFCFSDDPFTAGSTKCMKPAAEGQACGDYHTCNDVTFCDTDAVNPICIGKRTDGSPCNADLAGEDCHSGYCDDNNTCAAAAGGVPQGQPCTEDDTCEGTCAYCRPSEAGGAATCQLYGANGDYCRDWYDCMWDLGCTNHACGTVGEGEICGNDGENQNMCSEGLSCLYIVNCAQHNGDAAGCNGAAPACAWDDSYQQCSATQGACINVDTLPSSGACLHDMHCAAGFYCQPTDTTCQPLANEGENCSEDGSNAPFCSSGLTCVETSCRQLCEYNEDCGSGQFCSDEGNCEDYRTSDCEDSMQCAPDQYCLVPEDTCGDHDEPACGSAAECDWVADGTCDLGSDCWGAADEPACVALDGCTWDATNSACTVTCYDFDDDEPGCTGAGCFWEAATGYCWPSCTGATDEPTCGSTAGCIWVATGSCELSGGLVGSCLALKAVGEECTDGVECATGTCDTDSEGAGRCAVELSGCNNDGAYIRSVFLFGGVFILARGLRRRRG